MRTRPSASSVAVWPKRGGAVIGPVGLKVPVAGSYSSAEARAGGDPVARWEGPAGWRTRPSGSSVAVKESRAVVIEPVELKVPVLGS